MRVHELCGDERFGSLESIASGNSIARYAARFGYNVLQGREVFKNVGQDEDEQKPSSTSWQMRFQTFVQT